MTLDEVQQLARLIEIAYDYSYARARTAVRELQDAFPPHHWRFDDVAFRKYDCKPYIVVTPLDDPPQ